MSRHSIALACEQLTALDLDAFVSHAATLNQHHCTTFTTPFPKASSRWLSHYQFTPRPLALTTAGDVEGGRAICAPHYGPRGGPCYDPASLVVLEVAAHVDPKSKYVERAGRCWG